MALDTRSPRSRRALLGAALGAGVATVASALGRPLPVRAANGDYVQVGGQYTGTAFTGIEVTTEQPAFVAYSKATTGTAAGLVGEGYATDGTGVNGIARATTGFATGVRGDTFSPAGTGVLGVGGNIGVYGSTNQTYGIGVDGYAWSPGSDTSTVGVRGGSGNLSGAGVAGSNTGNGVGVSGQSGGSQSFPPRTGVYGYAAQDATARGVHGQTAGGRGVYGQATVGYGVRGYATTGTGGYFATSGLKNGTALRAVGRVKFDKSVGSATVTAGTKSVVVTPGIDLTSTSVVTATLMGSAGGTTTVHRVSVNATADTFTIYLTAISTANVKVGWHVFG